MPLHDDRLAKASRLLRHNAGLRQIDLHTSRYVAQEIEAGRSGELTLDGVKRHFDGLGARLNVGVWWNGAALDCLLDQRHAEVVNATASVLLAQRFAPRTEFTYSDFGERGSIDLFATREDVHALFIGEAKSEWGSLEETLRRQDAKVRLAPKLCRQAFGWTPQFVASVLIFPNDRTARRVADRYSATLGRYPARAREIRAWLSRPTRSLAGIWFLTNADADKRDLAQRR